MKRSVLFLLFAFCFFVLPAAAQEAEYIITETELIRLEKILGNWEKSKRNQQLQVHNLKMRLSEALTKSEDLKSQLQTERETLKSLKTSYNEYEKEIIKEIAEKEEKIQKKQMEIDDLKKQGYRLKLALVVLSCILALLLLGSVGFFILKMKLKFL